MPTLYWIFGSLHILAAKLQQKFELCKSFLILSAKIGLNSSSQITEYHFSK